MEFKSSSFKIFFNYIQIVGVLYSYQINWLNVFQDFLDF